MFLDIHAFDNVLSCSLNTNFLIDVIGEVLDLGGMDVVRCQGKAIKKVEFTLRDINDKRLKCCLWGKCAELLTSEAKVPNNGDICLIRFAKIRKNRGELQVSNSFDSTLVLINPDLAETNKCESNIILLDSAARTIVNASAAKLLNGSYDKFEDPEVLPVEIVEIVGNTYGFGVSGDENNIVYGAEIFEAIKCWSLDDILWKRIKSLHKLSLSKKKQCTNGVKIHASCKKTFFERLERHCRAGEWKVITNFTLSQASGFYRVTNHVYKMSFVGQTSISESALECDNMFLALHDFDRILSGSLNTCFLIDVIGEVLDLGGLDVVQCQGKERKKVEFTLRDIKYKLHLLVKDQTGESKFMLLDSIAKTIVKATAEKLLNGSLDEIEDPEMLPDEIMELVGKTYCFGIAVDESNIAYGVEFYKAMKVWNLHEIVTTESTVESANQSDKETPMLCCSEVSCQQIAHIPSSSDSLSTPSSKRSKEDNEVVAPDINSSTKKQCTKVIKIEKLDDDEGKEKNSG
ncbi:hypothetical protein F2Q69_00015180 [Brassica cretica]|uniref:Replication protein A 70 kDa DNA-binding subunit B/D first OB fold domain-containing protein n=1 Tax=Brassica cretica TaxID=69181 RepID=A0A8S9QLK1_BRACR|nr:hypothetical protein F2Q69_00015180 [Brassica cretica]